jgi:hypothetical protein
MLTLGSFFEKYRSSPNIWAAFFQGSFHKKWVGLHIGRLFSQTHLVALLSGENCCQPGLPDFS